MDGYLGTWELVPELCLYESGSPPEAATYQIDPTDDGVHVRISWLAAGAAEHASVEFAGPHSGEVTPVSGVPGVTGQSITRVDERTLDSIAWAGETVVVSARRVASADGALLVVLQTSYVGEPVRSYQVYRRGPSA